MVCITAGLENGSMSRCSVVSQGILPSHLVWVVLIGRLALAQQLTGTLRRGKMKMLNQVEYEMEENKEIMND
jgi:hypothetical protein